VGGGVMDYVEMLADLDEQPVLHKSRLLLLLYAFAGENNKGAVEGITKLAKLDFLLRYPTMLKHALEVKGASTRNLSIEDHELYSVESEMVRYRFGPWDHRYRLYLNLLVGEGLIKVISEGRKVVIALTYNGFVFANKLSANPLMKIYTIRAGILKRHFDMTSTSLMNFIYDTFPEIVSLNSGRRIQL
jgi:hypothetical protein